MVGREQTFPASLIKTINDRGQGETVAELVEVGGVRLDDAPRYDLIIDRISHEVPFYRAFLKHAALNGTIIINNPFWWSADDKFFNYTLAAKLGLAIPRTALLPQKSYIEGISGDSLRNLQFPLNWQEIIDYIGLPAILKPFNGGGWKNVSRIDSLQELWSIYDTSGTLCMTLQEMIDFDQFVRCYCIGQEEVMIMPYDPRKLYLSGEQYFNDPNYLSAELAARVTQDVRTICQALGYDINTVEFAIRDQIPYAIDFMNPAPDADLHSVGEYFHNWVIGAVTDLIFNRLAESPSEREHYRWDALLNSEQALSPAQALTPAGPAADAVASTVEQAVRTIVPQPVREISSEIVAGVGELVDVAATAVSNLIEAVAPEPSKPGIKKPHTPSS